MDKHFIFTDGTKLEIGTMYCIGQNYEKHAKEMGGEVPKDPVVFIKPPASYIPDGSSVILPDFSNNVHHEVELVVVIGKDCRNVSQSEARTCIAGYAVGIDVTLRDIQKSAKESGKPWAVAKGFVTSAPISQVIPARDFGDVIPYFDLKLQVNGELRQNGNTKDMARPVAMLIEYLSKVFTLREGDCIFTGTPEGVGKIISGDNISAELSGKVFLDISVE
jgi:2-keto-4-pentenoate hydratase/2-oxohepta-3-ene-1,7-dioic acid hydratase in catechol pathway